jgi:hypothetical protein
MIDLKFPEILFVSHFDHSSDESPSLNACVRQLDAVEENEPTDVAEYKLVRVRRLQREIKEIEKPL